MVVTSVRLLFVLLVAGVTGVLSQVAGTAQERMAKAMELASTGDYPASETILLELEKQFPRNAELQYRLGLVLLRQQKFAEAGRRLESAAELLPDFPQAWLAVARVRLQLGNRAGAIEAIEQANLLAPDEPMVWRASAMFYEQAADFAKAAEYELRWAEAHPDDKVSPLRAMEYHIRAGEPDPAIEIGERMLIREDGPVIHNLLGQAYRLKQDPANAVEELQTALRLDPANPRYYIDLAQLFLDHKTPKPALMVLARAVERFPNDAEILRLYGLAHYATGDKAKALDNFLKITDLDPDSEIGYAALETLLPHAEARLDEIIEKLRGFRRRHPSNPLGHYLLALALEAASPDAKGSEELLRKAISAEPSFWPAWYELHEKLERQGELAEAIRVLQKTVELNPGHAQAHYSLSRIYARLGEREKAMAARKRHHELVLEDRQETERLQEEYPRLPYTLRAGGPGPN